MTGTPIADLPGPPRLPLFGNAHQLLQSTRIHLVTERWAERYGPLFRVDIGRRRRLVVVSDLDAINKILRERPEGFRRWADQKVVIEETGPPGVFAAEGADWKRQRRLVLEALNIHYLSRYFEVVRTCTERLRGRLMESAREGRILTISEELTSYTVDVTSALALGHDLNTLERGDTELQGHIGRVMATTARRIASPVPYWRWIRLPADRAFDRSAKEMRGAIDGFIADARAKMEAEPSRYEEPENLLESMLAAQRADGTLSDDDIVGNMFTILLAGEDTTAHTLGWTIWLLTGRPEIQARIAAEGAAVLGGGERPIEYEDVEQLPYTEAVLKESMRLRPVAPFLPLESIEATTILGTEIPARTRLLLMTRYATREAAGRSEEFYPDRWLEKGEENLAPKSLAFGAGPRFCPGRNLALLEAKAALATICRDFELDLDESAPPVKEALKFAMVPENLRVKLQARERVPSPV
jgi:cytochrome P450